MLTFHHTLNESIIVERSLRGEESLELFELQDSETSPIKIALGCRETLCVVDDKKLESFAEERTGDK